MSEFNLEEFKKYTFQEDSEQTLTEKEQETLCSLLGTTDFQVAIIVNTASKCGFTKQYEGLESLYKQFKDKGLIVIAQPSNQFMNQEPGTDEEIKLFCESNYGVTFKILPKADVVLENSTSLYKELYELSGRIRPRWNFHKFIFSKKTGKLYSRSHFVDIDENFISNIEKLLA